MKPLLFVLAFLATGIQIAAQAGTLVSGIVRDQRTGQGIENAQVTLVIGTVVFRQLTSDATGRFSFAEVPPGSYRLQAERAGYFNPTIAPGDVPSSRVSANITLTGGQAQPQIELSLSAGGAISGRVVDSRGQPVPGMNILAHSPSYGPTGQRQLFPMPLALVQRRTTNDRGEYRIFDVPPGEYLIAAMPESTSIYTRTFHPGVVDPGAANIV